nr:protein suppressor of hairy wing-like isoform X1 [Procambarus clarkii]
MDVVLPAHEIYIKEEPREDLQVKVEADNDGQCIESDSHARTVANGHEVEEMQLGDVTSSDEETEKQVKVEADNDGQCIESDSHAHTVANGHEVEEMQLGDVTSSDEETEKQDMLECRMCKKKYSTTASLRAHLSKKHRIALGTCYTCYLCGAIGQSKATLKRHLIRTHGEHSIQQPELLRKCRHCGQGLASQAALYKHISLAHAEELDQYHRCPNCPALVRSRPSLLRHFSRSHPGIKFPGHEVQRCPKCDIEFRSRTALKVHFKARHPELLLHKCNICTSSFKYFYLLTRHIKACHESKPAPPPKRRYKCGECEREYCAKSRLEKHINHVHANPERRVFHCTLCNLTFSSSSRRVRHYRSVHRDRNAPHCSECTMYFETVEDLNIHRQEHKMNCAVCNKSFLRRDSLREHLLIHNGPKLPCPYCSKTFTQNSNLKRHIRIHTGEKPYKCTFCSKSFGDKSACNSHIRVHTGAERCMCHLCGASFSKRQKLNYHMRKHTGQGLLYCPLCIKPTTNSYALKKHIETHQQALVPVLLSMGISSQVEDCHQLALKALHDLASAAVQNSLDNQMRNAHFLDSDTCTVNEFNVDHVQCGDAENADVPCKHKQTDCEIEREKSLNSNVNHDQRNELSGLRANSVTSNKEDIQCCKSIVEGIVPSHKSLTDNVTLSAVGSQQDGELGETALKNVLSGESDPLVDMQCCNIKCEDSMDLESESETVEKLDNHSCVASPKHLITYGKISKKTSAPEYNEQNTLDCDNLVKFRDNVFLKRHLNNKEDTSLKKQNQNEFFEEGSNTLGISNGIYEEPVVVLTRLLEDIVESHCRQTEIDSFKPTLGDQLVEQCLQVIMNDDVKSDVPKDEGDDVSLDLGVHHSSGLHDSDRYSDHGVNRIIDNKHKKPYTVGSISCQNYVGVDTNYSHGIRLRDMKFFTSLNSGKLLDDSKTIISNNKNKYGESDSCNISRESVITNSSAIINKEINLIDSSKLHICKSPETCVKIFCSCLGENFEQQPTHCSCRDVCSKAFPNRSEKDGNSKPGGDDSGLCLDLSFTGMHTAPHQVKSSNSSVYAQRESSPANAHESRSSGYHVNISRRKTEKSSSIEDSEICSESNTSKLRKIKLSGLSKRGRIESILRRTNRFYSTFNDFDGDKDSLITNICEKRGRIIVAGDDKEHNQNVHLPDDISGRNHGRTVAQCKGNYESISGMGCEGRDVTLSAVRKNGDQQDHQRLVPNAQERTVARAKWKGNDTDHSLNEERQLQPDGSFEGGQFLKPRLSITCEDKDQSTSIKLEDFNGSSSDDPHKKLSLGNGIVSMSVKKPVPSVKVKEISHLRRISQAVPPRPMCPLVEKSTKFFSSPTVSVSYKSYVPAEGSIEERTCE